MNEGILKKKKKKKKNFFFFLVFGSAKAKDQKILVFVAAWAFL